ncbi:MAG: PP2C family protein-serine/threonine phosphatase [Phycisphaerales bacterium]
MNILTPFSTGTTGRFLEAQSGMATPAPSSRPDLPLVDLSRNTRIPVLMELTDALSKAQSPQQVLEAIILAMRKAYGPRCYISLSTAGLESGHFRISRWLEVDGTERIRTGDPWGGAAGTDLPSRYGGVLSRLIATPEPKLVQNMCVRGDPVVADAFDKFGSLVAVPIIVEGQVANWTVILHEDANGLGVADLEQLILRGNLIGTTMNNVLIANRLREATDWIRHEVDHIAQIQRSLLPQSSPNIPGVAVASKYETFDRAGGDYYDLLPLTVSADGHHEERQGPWGIMIADASGHGPAAAVVVAMLHAILHAREQEVMNPAACLDYLNQRLFARRVGSEFVTAFFGVYEPQTRKLTYANAGHAAPILRLRGGGSIQRLDAVGGIPLGVMDRVGSDHASVTLEPGQSLVLFTDGVTETIDASGRQFGSTALEAVILGAQGGPDAICESISNAVKRHRGGARAHDDQTIVALNIRED